MRNKRTRSFARHRDRQFLWNPIKCKTIVSCSALHFAFAWSGHWKPIAIVAAVNESVWEHLKLAFWPGLLWALLEAWFVRLDAWRFWAAKGLALIVAPLLIVLLFYGYTNFIGRNLLVLDIAVFVISVACSQLTSIWLLQSQKLDDTLQRIGIVTFISQLAAFSIFTYFPPMFSLFEDQRNGVRGLPPEAGQTPMNHTGPVRLGAMISLCLQLVAPECLKSM